MVPSAVLSSQSIIDNIDISPTHSISPNGDGVSDSMIITYDLSDTATTVYLLIVQSDSSTVVDTLVNGAAQGPSMSHAAVWDGTVAGGIRVADDNYFVLLQASDGQFVDRAFSPISVDVVPPQTFVTNKFPNPFAPAFPDSNPQILTVQFATFDAFPSDSLDVRALIKDPTGGTIATVPDTWVAANGTHTVRWDGTEASVDGNHEIHIVASDRAGNTDVTRGSFVVDLNPPEVEFTAPQSDLTVQVVPDSLFEWAYDASRDITLEVRYTGVGDYEPIQSTILIMDTLFFAVQLTDSVVLQQQKYNIGVRATDTFGRQTPKFFDITWDTIPPLKVVLNQPPSPTRNPSLLLTGTVDADVDTMNIYRNGALVDRIAPNLPVIPEFPYTITLVPGNNAIYAIAFDAVGNSSGQSNEISVVLDRSPGLLISVPFLPNDAFLLNLSKPASTVVLRVYDLGGGLVQVLNSTSAGTNIALPWDGRNGNGEAVKKGPLVAIAKIQYQDGGSEVFREAFLYEP